MNTNIISDNLNLEDAFPPDVLRELHVALQEPGTLEAVWNSDYETFVVRHPLYPSIAADDDTPEKALYRYKGYLCNFIQERLKGNTSSITEAETTGRAGTHGGRRAGAGRKPQGPRARISIPLPLADWLRDEDNLKKVAKLANIPL